MFNEGISQEGDIINVGVKHEVIKKAGAFYSYGETRLGQGMEKSKQFLRDNPEIYSEIEEKVFEKVGLTSRLKDKKKTSKKEISVK